MNPLKAGDIAPKFSLPDQDGEQVNLTDFQGQRVLVYFYPKAMTPGCTGQACGVWGEKSFMGKTYDGIHRISFLTDADGKIEHVFDDFKTSNHHDVVLNWLKEHA